CFFFQAEDGIRDWSVTGVQTCALPISGRDAVVILGHEFWTRALHADRSVLGRTVRLNGIAFTVIGVMPEHFTGLDRYTRFEFYRSEERRVGKEWRLRGSRYR